MKVVLAKRLVRKVGYSLYLLDVTGHLYSNIIWRLSMGLRAFLFPMVT